MKKVDLLNGPITASLARLAFPIMGTSFIQMAYNLTDMVWIGGIGSGAVAAVGAAGMFTWLFNGTITVPKIGGQIKVAHALGAGETEHAVQYAKGDLQIGIFFSILFGIISVLFAEPLISFYKLNDPAVIADAKAYLMITGGLVIFNFLINIILDPLLIYGVGPLPKLGVAGAAIATVFAQIIVFLMYIRALSSESLLFSNMHLLKPASMSHIIEMVKLGLPVGLQSMLFSMISMTIARIVADYGAAAVAVQKVGAQIESIAWMTAEGFGSAVNSFIAQNHGAGKKERIRKGYFTAMTIMLLWGTFTSVVLFVFPEQLMQIFIHEADVVPIGVDYLKILAVSEVFACLEMTAAGAFQGLGKSIFSSLIIIIFTALRIPMALALSATALGLNGVWWSISISSIIRGLLLPAAFGYVLHHYMKSATNNKFI